MRRKWTLLCCFFFFSCTTASFAQQLAPAIVWQKCLGGSGDEKANSIVRTPDGGFIVAGSSTSNNGDVSGHHGSPDSTDGWVVKISATGTVQWQASLGGSGTDVFNSIIALADGNFVCIGTSSSNDGDVTGNHGRTDWWVVKISPYGAVIWSKCYGGSMPETAGHVSENSDGTLYLTGSTMSVDGDVTGHHTGGGIYDQDIWVVKLNSSGSINWARCFGGAGQDIGYDIHESDNGSFIIGIESSSTDGDFGDISEPDPRGAIAKIASDYSVIWLQGVLSSKPISLMPTGTTYDVNTDVLGCIPNLDNFAATQYEFTDIPGSNSAPPLTRNASYTFCSNGFSPPFLNGFRTVGSSGIARVNAVDHLFAGSSDDSVDVPGFHGGPFDGFVSGYKTNTGIAYEKFIGGSRDDELSSVLSIDPYGYMVAGFTNSNDGDVSGNHGGYDVWLIKMGRVNTIKGTVYQDYNHNNVKDPNEPFVNSIIVQSQKGLSTSASSTYNGYFDNLTDTGTYVTKVLTNPLYYTAFPVSKSSSFTTYNNSDSFSFALQPIAGIRDYAINLWAFSTANPGFTADYSLMITNKGTDTLVNRGVSLIMDSRMQFLSASPAQAAVSGDTISWIINKLSPRDTTSILVHVQLKPPPDVNYNDTLFLTASVDSSGDVHSADNTSGLYQQVLGSFDPNSKEEVHAGSIGLGDVTQGKELQYTIRFQNTGNDTAYTVVIRDTLETKLSASSISMVSASHPYILTIQDSSILTWTFQNILLPDSIHHEPQSHGYVSYRIKPRNNLVVGDVIRNTAAAYFDFNLPVQTNTELTIIKKQQPPLVTPLLSPLDTAFCLGAENKSVKILNYPSAGSGITVNVLLDGAQTLSVGPDSSFIITMGGLAAGHHTAKVNFTDLYDQSKSATLSFSIRTGSSPKLSLSASNTAVGSSTTDPVIITASNSSGGDANALFTFALDNGFQQILQAQSSNRVLSVQPSSLFVGDNWIYVKMSTTGSCQTTPFVVDSIKIVRSLSTGLIDPDNPGQPITAYPNPFKLYFMITGLNPGKQYEIIIYNNAGQRVLDKVVTDQSSCNINQTHFGKGYYSVRVYDRTRDRLIGIIKMISE
jgi:uncharacterized repeat protein (TIGR01451 family)